MMKDIVKLVRVTQIIKVATGQDGTAYMTLRTIALPALSASAAPAVAPNRLLNTNELYRR